jgi:enamine deaminase RidA (YjgF/YER057c/UK114 family)
MTTRITHHNPAGLPRNPAFSQAVSVEGPTRTIYVGGQNAVDADGTVAFVAGLADPQFLVEVSAVAVVPQGA